MTEIPKLTADEAEVIRERRLVVGMDRQRKEIFRNIAFELMDRKLLGPINAAPTPLGLAALAAFDAAERAKIRVEAMRECEAVAAEFAKRSERVDDPREFFEDLILDIRALIAKETP